MPQPDVNNNFDRLKAGIMIQLLDNVNDLFQNGTVAAYQIAMFVIRCVLGRFLECFMGLFSVRFVQFSCALTFLASALASSGHAGDRTTCRASAEMAAQTWSGGVLTPAKSSIGARPADAILVIAGGDMFSYRPAAGNDVRIAQDVGQKIRDFHFIMQDTYDRCRES
jgi:hypothetical protein